MGWSFPDVEPLKQRDDELLSTVQQLPNSIFMGLQGRLSLGQRNVTGPSLRGALGRALTGNLRS